MFQNFATNRAMSLSSRHGTLSNAYCEGLNNAIERTVRIALLQKYSQCEKRLNAAAEAYRIENSIIAQHPERFADESAIAGLRTENTRQAVTRSGEISRELCPSYTQVNIT